MLSYALNESWVVDIFKLCVSYFYGASQIIKIFIILLSHRMLLSMCVYFVLQLNGHAPDYMNGHSPEYNSNGISDPHEASAAHSMQTVQDRLKHIRAGSPFRYRANPLANSTPDISNMSRGVRNLSVTICQYPELACLIIVFNNAEKIDRAQFY